LKIRTVCGYTKTLKEKLKIMIKQFNKNTYLAFIDICGFKNFMKNKSTAQEVLNDFYQNCYDLMRQKITLNSIVISDCAIVFHRIDNDTEKNGLKTILEFVKQLNIIMLKSKYNVLLTSSISFGNFNYNKKINLKGMEKNAIYGDAYLDAYFDNENGKPKLVPGECRIVKNEKYLNKINNDLQKIKNSSNFVFETSKKHIYYYWFLNDSQQISELKIEKSNAKYIGLKKIYNDYIK